MLSMFNEIKTRKAKSINFSSEDDIYQHIIRDQQGQTKHCIKGISAESVLTLSLTGHASEQTFKEATNAFQQHIFSNNSKYLSQLV